VKEAPEGLYGAARQILARGSTQEPSKRDQNCVFAIVPGWRAQRCLLVLLSAACPGF